jgi:hypothetical protein
MTLTDVLLLALLLVVATGLVAVALQLRDRKAPRGRRVALTTADDLTFVGFIAHEDRHRVILENAALAAGESETPLTGRQHFRTAAVKRVQEFAD